MVDIQPDYAKIKFSHMTTQDEMYEIQANLKSISNIEFVFDQSEFLEYGHLQTLKIGIKTPNGNTGSCSADLMKLQFNYYGFEYNPDGNPNTRIGIMQ